MSEYMKRSEASTTTDIKIQLTGFPSVEKAKEFLLAIIKPELQAPFRETTMKFDSGVAEAIITICCNADQTEFATCSPDPVSELCVRTGSGCPTTF